MGGEGVGGGLGEALERPQSPVSRYDEERIFSPENEKTRTLLACFSNHDAAQPTVSDLDRGHLLGVIRNAVGFIARLRAARSTFKYPLPTVISSCDERRVREHSG